MNCELSEYCTLPVYLCVRALSSCSLSQTREVSNSCLLPLTRAFLSTCPFLYFHYLFLLFVGFSRSYSVVVLDFFSCILLVSRAEIENFAINGIDEISGTIANAEVSGILRERNMTVCILTLN